MGIVRRYVALVVMSAAVLAAPGSTASASAREAETAPAARAKVKACSDLRAQTGITRRAVTLANVVDVSGPVPGLHEGAQTGIEAFLAYADAAGIRICGRRLEVRALDARTDASADRTAYRDACSRAFAAVGSLSEYDAGGAPTAAACGLPDLRVTSVSAQRRACRTCVAVRPSGVRADGSRVFPASVPDRLVAAYPDEVARTAYVYVDSGTTTDLATAEARAWAKRGLGIDLVTGIGTTEFNYAPYVRQLKDRNIAVVRWLGAPELAARFVQAMQQQGYTPTAFVLDSEAYSSRYLEIVGSAAESVHTLAIVDAVPFEEQSTTRELQLYTSWLEQVRPGQAPTIDGLYAWSAARLFVREARALKGSLTRAALVRRLRAVTRWNGLGMHASQPVAAGTVAGCWRFLRPDEGAWVPAGSRAFLCGGLVSGS